MTGCLGFLQAGDVSIHQADLKVAPHMLGARACSFRREI